MSLEHLDELIEKLNGGDLAAAERAFLAYEPYLRMAVRRQLTGPLRSKLDSMDIVQSVWADVLGGFRQAGWRFTDRSHLRAFLIKVARNRLIDRRRQHHRALEQERPLELAAPEDLTQSNQPRPSEIAQSASSGPGCSRNARPPTARSWSSSTGSSQRRDCTPHRNARREHPPDPLRARPPPGHPTPELIRFPWLGPGRGLTNASPFHRSCGRDEVAALPDEPEPERPEPPDSSSISRLIDAMAASWGRGQPIGAGRDPGQ